MIGLSSYFNKVPVTRELAFIVLLLPERLRRLWLPDVRRLARVVAALIRPSEFLYLTEFHPIKWVFDGQRGHRSRARPRVPARAQLHALSRWPFLERSGFDTNRPRGRLGCRSCTQCGRASRASCSGRAGPALSGGPCSLGGC